jgi:hypothetical protein
VFSAGPRPLPTTIPSIYWADEANARISWRVCEEYDVLQYGDATIAEVGKLEGDRVRLDQSFVIPEGWEGAIGPAIEIVRNHPRWIRLLPHIAGAEVPELMNLLNNKDPFLRTLAFRDLKMESYGASQLVDAMNKANGFEISVDSYLMIYRASAQPTNNIVAVLRPTIVQCTDMDRLRFLALGMYAAALTTAGAPRDGATSLMLDVRDRERILRPQKSPMDVDIRDMLRGLRVPFAEDAQGNP